MPSKFGKRLAQARDHAGFTQQDLAALVPMAQSTLASAESNGDGSRVTAQIAHHCGVDAYWLATGEGEMLAGQPRERLQPTPPTLDLSQALPVVLGRLPGLDDYTADLVLGALRAATRPAPPLERIEADLLRMLGARAPAASGSTTSAKRSSAT